MGPKMAAIAKNQHVIAVEATTVEVTDWTLKTGLAFRWKSFENSWSIN